MKEFALKKKENENLLRHPQKVWELRGACVLRNESVPCLYFY